MSYYWGCANCKEGSNGMDSDYKYCPYCGHNLEDRNSQQSIEGSK